MKKFFWKDKTGRGFTGNPTLSTILAGEDATSWDGESLHEWAESCEEGEEWENSTEKYICTES